MLFRVLGGLCWGDKLSILIADSHERCADKAHFVIKVIVGKPDGDACFAGHRPHAYPGNPFTSEHRQSGIKNSLVGAVNWQRRYSHGSLTDFDHTLEPHLLDLGRQSAVEHPQLPGGISGFI